MSIHRITLTPEQKAEAEAARLARERASERERNGPPPGTALARLRAAPQRRPQRLPKDDV